MCSKQLLLFACLMLLSGGLRLTSTTTTTTFVAAMSIANQDLERYFRSANATQAMSTVTEDRIAMDVYTYAFLNYSYIDDDKTIESDYKDEMARYGEGKILSVSGKLVHITDANDVSDDTACSSNIMGTLGDPTPAAGTAWIALVRRGLCTFEDKVRNVYAKGAKGVIVYNDKPVQILEKMQIKGKNRNITAVMTYQDVGLKMARIVDDRFDMICHITEGRSAMRPLNSLNRTSVLFVSISFIVLMVISLIWLIIYYIQRFRYLHTKEQQSRQLCNVTKKAIMKIPTKTGKSSDEKDLDSDCCAICIEAYKPSDCIRVLPCKHEFHKNCIDPWLIEHRTCPMCKLDVLKFYGYVVGDQIYNTPSPQHIPPNLAEVDENDVPIIVMSVPVHNALVVQHQQQQQQQQSLSQTISRAQRDTSNQAHINSSSISISHSSSSCSNSSNSISNDSNNDSDNNISDNKDNNSRNRVTPSDCACGGSSNVGLLHNSNGNITDEGSVKPLVMEVCTASRQVTDV